MSYFIIIRGPLGCGKSTIARKLVDILNAEYISIDEILAKNGLDEINPKIGCISEDNFIKANEAIIPHANEMLSKGRVVIFDACFYHKKPIEHLIKKLKFPYYIFTLKAPLEVCIERDSKREKKHGKNAARDVYKLVSKFDYGIVIDVSKSVDKSVEEILSYLPR
ncbi:MAG: ATP-binding protein [Candidatus Aenigmarchaeota archaeon]|nr:ATP-binding protein [Candidatus Aenigmarchaeota archaeon]OIN87778.1 MAG: hypothetical protein AUJ50_02360 [Candidatus Aenigmarchaeota archaeon CG1_02_38_14]PIW41586.1 MAG: hypothetical protein COW21_01105 [Candidatus Aenigmarchaeota archaeon CG15_BIG_FIL_POST_REV_8_21_14_020_37_27]PIX50474.1 MAG: hypothetical protein COZ52_03910 [Candidatus Aenigmarchaeota archaeon CG_4_8_14_3_um_filter_37_24]PJB75176.1 MAG: hypothetical protein CO092_02535 [Candidatus Aenigmarchaeota archaeon CG_4_9_14_3_um